MHECCVNNISIIKNLEEKPDAVAQIRGSDEYPDIIGNVWFYQLVTGVMVITLVQGLPIGDNDCGNMVFGYHIHDGSSCLGNKEDACADSGMHYNPKDYEHPYHAGDMPPLFGNCGYAFSAFLTNRFCVEEVIGGTVIIHLNPDDFYSQPSGGSGKKIACGQITY